MTSSSFDTDLSNSLVSITYSRLLARELKVEKDNAADFLKGTDLTFDQLQGLDSKITFSDQAKLVSNAKRISGNPALGLLMGPKLHIATHGPLGTVLIASPNVEVMLRSFVKYSTVRAQFARFSMEETDKHFVVVLEDIPGMGDFHDFFYELLMSILQYALEEVLDRPFIEGRYAFVHKKPTHEGSYSEYLHSPFEFNAERYLFCVPKEMGKIPSPLSDSQLFNHATELCDEKLRELEQERSLEQTIQKILYDNPGHIWALEEVASALNMSSRTVMRKLKAEDTTYKQILDGVHKDMTIRYLKHKNLSVNRISYLLGYSDTSAFRRSFKRWFGMSVTEYLNTDLSPS